MILDFSEATGARHFEFCFVGFVLGGSMQDKKGISVLRTEVGLFEKLESVSEPKPCGRKLVNGEHDRQLKTGAPSPAQIQLSLPEYDLLHHYLSQVPWQSGTPTKHAVETIDWLEAIHRASRA